MRIMFRFKVDNMLESCPGRKAQEQRSEPCVQVTSPHIICQSIHGQRTYLYNYTSPHAYITFIILLYFLQNHRYAGVAPVARHRYQGPARRDRRPSVSTYL